MSRRLRHLSWPCLVILASCATGTRDNSTGSIGELRRNRVDLTDVKIDGGTDLAIQSYKRFLDETPEGGMTPQALRRLADLKVQKEYGTLEGVKRNQERAARRDTTSESAAAVPAPASATVVAATAPELTQPTTKAKLAQRATPKIGLLTDAAKKTKGAKDKTAEESSHDFEVRATQADAIRSAGSAPVATPDGTAAEVQGEAAEAIALYEKLLATYPHYERNDQVLYQLSRAYDESGATEKAMGVMNRIAKEYPGSRYFDEVEFRIGEYHFTRKKWLAAEEAYKSVADKGAASAFYELALYKLGWTFYKQDMQEESLHRFMALLDHKINTGYDFDKPKDKLEHQRVEDTYRAISLGFSSLGGAEAVNTYFGKYGRRSYEVNVYGNLAEHFLDKLRYNDAAATYKAFVRREPYHKIAPHYDTRVIEIYKRGGFPKLVIDANKEYVVKYGPKAAYWNHFDIQGSPEVVGYVKTSLKELANHYHALYQEKKFEKDKPENFREAMRWYRDYLASFPKELESPVVNQQLAELLLENGSFADAAVEFEHTAYDYPAHDKASEAGYAAVYAHRKSLAAAGDQAKVKQETIRSSLKFAETFSAHEKAAPVMSAAIDDIFEAKDYALAVTSSRKFIERFPNAEQTQRRAAWITLAHSSLELGRFKDAEESYLKALPLVAEGDKSRANLVENLAAAIYKQGEEAGKQGDHQTAAQHYLRVAQAAPTSTIRPVAEYDGATALIQLKDWDGAANVLTAFRSNHAGHKLLPEVTKKVAYVYREAGRLALAATEYERIAAEAKEAEVRSDALLLAGDLFAQAKETDKALAVYRRYIASFPTPLDLAIETRFKVASILKSRHDTEAWRAELKGIVSTDADGGKGRTDRTRYLAASSRLALAELVFDQYTQIKLVEPIAKNLAKKKEALKQVKEGFEAVLRYEIGETTAAASYYLGEMYYDFNRSLVESERPSNLAAAEKEQYELALEEQAFPFEEKAIDVHQKNTDLVKLGIYNKWVDKSFRKLATLVPARYAKFEESTGYVETFNRLVAFGKLTARPEPVVAAATPQPDKEVPAATAGEPK
ncbi:tetratricopeptide repeat protein [uncultured Piscinibacter sp.]|uniref:tetratricopeptide repeat protein n=1 Tax=uncultured Piscinibacter sp. TaxID=1131835 RepID=UPI0026179868|nr:tetratricopeptide repeat protein [uncultured Piscinibacter sp.]